MKLSGTKSSHVMKLSGRNSRIMKIVNVPESLLGDNIEKWRRSCPCTHIFSLIALYSISTVVFSISMDSTLTFPFQSPVNGWPESNSFGDRRYQTLCGSFWWRPIWRKTCKSPVISVFSRIRAGIKWHVAICQDWSNPVVRIYMSSVQCWILIINEEKNWNISKEYDQGDRWTKKRHLRKKNWWKWRYLDWIR